MSIIKVQPNRPMRIAYWITKATNTHSEYIQLIAFSLQQLLHERASILRYTYIADLFLGLGVRVNFTWNNYGSAVFCISMTSAACSTRISYLHGCLAKDGSMRKSTKGWYQKVMWRWTTQTFNVKYRICIFCGGYHISTYKTAISL